MTPLAIMHQNFYRHSFLSATIPVSAIFFVPGFNCGLSTCRGVIEAPYGCRLSLVCEQYIISRVNTGGNTNDACIVLVRYSGKNPAVHTDVMLYPLVHLRSAGRSLLSPNREVAHR